MYMYVQTAKIAKEYQFPGSATHFLIEQYKLPIIYHVPKGSLSISNTVEAQLV